MMDGGEIIGLVAVLSIITIPSLGLVARFALRPIVESMLKLRESFDRQGTGVDAQRLTLLEQRVTDMQDSIERLTDAVEFDRQLRSSSTMASLPGSKTS